MKISEEETKELVRQLDAMIAVNKKQNLALAEIANPNSPFDGTGEPLQVRIAKDLTRRIDIARSAL